jgi:hypothetical protein
MGENDPQLSRIDTFCIVPGASPVYVPGGREVGGERGEESGSDGQAEFCARAPNDLDFAGESSLFVFHRWGRKRLNHQVGEAIKWREHDRGARMVFHDCHWQILSPAACTSVSRTYGGRDASEVKVRGCFTLEWIPDMAVFRNLDASGYAYRTEYSRMSWTFWTFWTLWTFRTCRSW